MIRLEEEKDYKEVENLTREAFWNVYCPGCVEHYLIHKLRKDDCFIKELDFVLEKDHRIIGHIAYAKSYIKQGDYQKEVILFGPVSILPVYQHRGYGHQLIEYSMNKARKMGYSAIVITGNPEYYQRFGFVRASKYNLYYEGMEEDFPYFMIKVFDETQVFSGIYNDPACYHVSSEDVDKFDQQFPSKMKEKHEGQLF